MYNTVIELISHYEILRGKGSCQSESSLITVRDLHLSLCFQSAVELIRVGRVDFHSVTRKMAFQIVFEYVARVR
jgi:hypothetical protein